MRSLKSASWLSMQWAARWAAGATVRRALAAGLPLTVPATVRWPAFCWGLLCLLTACGRFPLFPITDCDVECIDKGCPEGLACQAGYCVQPDSTATCKAPTTETLPALDAPVLTIESRSFATTCTGEELRIDLRVSGGTAPYDWGVVRGVTGLSLVDDGSSRAYLFGTLQESGASTIGLKVSSGGSNREFEVALTVHQTPQLNVVLPDACRNEEYDQSLLALGGDSSSYQWRVEGLPAGLSESEGAIVGIAPDLPATLTLNVSLRDQYCPSDPDTEIQQEFSWKVLPANECIQISTRGLAAACVGQPYEHVLATTGGKGNARRWALESGQLPAGLVLDVERGVIEGTPTENLSESSSFELSVNDTTGRIGHRTFKVPMLSSCWFAYLTEEESVRQLHYRDIPLSEDYTLLAEAAQSAGATNIGVSNFKFSPDGQYLAFRSGPAAQAVLSLFSTANRQQSPVTVNFNCPGAEACAVLDYAWSNNSQHLAVILSGTSPEQDYLSGLSVGTPLQLWEPLGSILVGDAQLPLDYREQLVWHQSTSVGFFGAKLVAATELQPLSLYSALNVAGTLTSLKALAIDPPIGSGLRSTPGGLVVIGPPVTPEDPHGYDQLIALSERAPAQGDEQVEVDRIEYYAGQLSPSRRWLAVSFGPVGLEVFDKNSGVEPIAIHDTVECPSIFAWSAGIGDSGRERIACRSGDDINFLDFNPETRTLSTAGSFTFASETRNVRRAFSPDGNWFVLGDVNGNFSVYRIDGSTRNPILSSFPLPTQPASAELLFPAASSQMTLFGGAYIREFSLPPATASSGTLSSSSPPPACQEVYWQSPEKWCGNPSSRGNVQYEPSGLVALVTAANQSLALWDATAQFAQPIASGIPSNIASGVVFQNVAFQP